MPSTWDWKARGAALKASDNADKAEYAAIDNGSSSLETGIHDDRTAGAMDDYDVPGPQPVAPWATADTQFDSAVGAIGDEIRRRAKILGTIYPFDLTECRLTHHASYTLVYEFCLAVSQAATVSQGEHVHLARAFERLSRDVVMCYLGPDSDGYRTGWPGDDVEPRPTRFKALIEEIQKRSGEWAWSPALGMPDDGGDEKDGGLDFIVWKGFSDGRQGQLFLVGQCAAGRGWEEKLRALDLNMLQHNWLDLPCVRPVRVFVIPRHIPNDAHLARVSSSAGLTLDRTRIVLLAEAKENRKNLLARRKDPYEKLIRLVIPGFEVAESAA